MFLLKRNYLKVLIFMGLFSTYLSAQSLNLPFSESVKVGDTLYLSGQIAYDKKTKKVVSGGIVPETKMVLENIKTSLEKEGYTLDEVVKCTIMLKEISDFKAFNGVYSKFFSKPYPARSTFAVKDLALNAKIEIECMASK